MERYGLFVKSADGSPIWVCAEDDLAQAKARIKDLDRQTGLEHFVFEFRSSAVVATSRSAQLLGAKRPQPRASGGRANAD